MDQQKSVLEVVNTEKQMLALIYSKGILDNDVLELYHKIRTVHEKALLNSNQMVERQEVEYHLWRLHYQIIDELRKKIKRRSYYAGNIKNDNPPDDINSDSNSDKGFKGFKSFLSEANEFYRELIVKFRKNCGLTAEIFLNNKDRVSISVEPEKVHACEHTCHRLLICLGDLARYTEIVKKPDACEWFTAAKYYLEASRTWPDSGNPHNQLALLATYVGDGFLALYHCVRSLAVKEPFPDAWRNIMLLFEENRSSKLPSFSSKMQLDFLNPSNRSYLQTTSHEDNTSPQEYVCSEKSDLWPLLVRTISFLLTRSSLDEFPCSLASALHCLQALLAIDDTKFTVSLESYQSLDASRKGPYRAIQLVSIFIFIIHSLTESPEIESKSTGKNNEIHSALKPFAFAAIFICMGRLTERCMNGNNTNICPLLPAVLVFIEWLVGSLDTVEAYEADERFKSALSYFFGALTDLLDRMEKIGEKTTLDNTALWEDHELKGFYPLTRVHEMLDFEAHLECMDNYTSRNQFRFQRIFHAAKRISDVKSTKSLNQSFHESNSGPKTQPTMEDEEVILFKPITRHNSAPVYISEPKKDLICPHSTETQTTLHTEWLRRAMSLSARQNNEDTDSFSFYSTTSNNEPLVKDSTPHPTGPPSLSAWNIGIEKGPHQDFNKHENLSPIEEIVSTSLVGLSINENKDDSKEGMGLNSTIIHESSRVMPIPSAPLLPEDAAWLRANPSFSLNEYKNEADGILGVGPTSGYAVSWSAIRPPMGHPPFFGMSSSEWLYHYRNSQNMAGNHLSPIHFDSPSSVNFHPNELSRLDICDQWGNHFVSSPMMYLGSTPQLYSNSSLERDKYFLGYQRPFPYVCGVGMEMSPEEPALLQHLKEKERQLRS